MSALVLFVCFLVAIRMTSNETVVDFRLHALAFAVMIINAATNPLSFYGLKNKSLDYLGQISYGLYIYHPACIGLAVAVAKIVADKTANALAVILSLYATTFALTIAVSALSYSSLESFFRNIRNNIAA